jgi:predicted homoserine dehydrogenase-like protein
MNLFRLLQERVAEGRPVTVGLIGAGKFGSMFLAQARHTPGLRVAAIADLDPDRARAALAETGWTGETRRSCSPSAAPDPATIHLTDDALELVAADGLEVVVDATGNPPAGLVYSMAYGDQPALICEMVDWAQAAGFGVVAAGKGTKYLPSFHDSTPETVWDSYGISPERAAEGGMNPQMFNSFLDGTKSAIEMAAVSNATGLTPAPEGLGFPPAGTDQLAQVLRPRAEGGTLHHKGQVEVVSSLHRNGEPVERDLRWGVYMVFEAPSDYTARCFAEYGLVTDRSGRYSATYKPYHLIGLEVGVSVLSAALRGEPTGTPAGFVGDAVAVAKRRLRAGDSLDGEGGFTVRGRLMPAGDSLAMGALPIGLAHNVPVVNDVPRGSLVTWADVRVDETSDAVRTRRDMEARLAPTRVAATA